MDNQPATPVQEADFVIVGAGSAGCILANRLSANPAFSVILIEAGGADTHPFIHMPAGFVHLMNNPALNWLYTSQPQAHLDGRKMAMPRGKVLGGTSSINGMLYVRGQSADFDGWAQAGNQGWSFKDVLPYFKKSVHTHISPDLLDAELHGFEGEMQINAPATRYRILDRVIEAAAEMGYPAPADYNGHSQTGFGYFQLTQKQGRRHSSYQAFVAPVKGRKNLKIIKKKQVIKLDFSSEDSQKVTGVILSDGHASHLIRAHREVILSAGAFGSPHLLELSGIGNARRLKQFGIEVVADVPAVGEHLADHFLTRLSYRLKVNDSLNSQISGVRLWREILRYAVRGTGALTMPAGIVGGFVASPYTEPDMPDIQYHIAHASFANPARRQFDKFPGLSIGPCQLRPHSRGHVHCGSANPFDAPHIQPNYLADERDRQVLLAGIRIARELMQTSVMAPLIEAETRPGAGVISDEELLGFVRETGNTVYHPVSTCRMGPADQANHVVTPDLKVRQIRNLRIADASVMPSITSGNTHAPTMMIAEKAADMILASHNANNR